MGADDVLNTIVAAAVDLTNDRSIADGATAADGLGQGPEAAPIVTLNVDPGDTARFTLYVNNTGELPESYKLAASIDRGPSSSHQHGQRHQRLHIHT